MFKLFKNQIKKSHFLFALLVKVDESFYDLIITFAPFSESIQFIPDLFLNTDGRVILHLFYNIVHE